MFTKLSRPLATLFTVLVLLGLVITPAFAATPQPATERAGAGAPVGGWVTLQPNQVHWYKFTYRYDNSEKDNQPTQAVVMLKQEMAGGASFSIETPGNLAKPLEDEDGNWRGPVGVGSPPISKRHEHEEGKEPEVVAATNEHGMVIDDMQLVWAGAMRTKETFYVIVKNNHDHPCAYKLMITGPDVSF
jgi:hypothetical protein